MRSTQWRLGSVRLRCRGVAAALCAMTLAAGVASAQPVNDTCAGAIAISPASLPYSTAAAVGNTATDEGAAVGNCAAGITRKGIWYSYTPTVSSQVTVTFSISASSFPSGNGGRFIGVSRSTSGGTCETRVSGIAPCAVATVNTDASTSIFTAQAGQTYYITVGPRAANGSFPADAVYNFALNAVPMSPPPVNDSICGAIELSASPSSWTIDASGAGDDAVSGTSCDGTHRRGVWYKYTSTFTGRATFSFDSLGDVTINTGKRVTVYTATGACPGPLTLTAVPDANTPASTCQSIPDSVPTALHTRARFSFDVSPGVTYYMLVASGTHQFLVYPPGAEYSLSFATSSAPANDDCVNAAQILSLPYSTTLNVGAAANSTLGIPPFNCVRPVADVWYTYTPNTDELVQVVWSGPNQELPSPDSYNAGSTGIYTGTCGNFVPVGCTPGKADPASVFTLRGGQTYYFMMGRVENDVDWLAVQFYADDTYSFEISKVTGTPLAASPNDECEDAIAISAASLPFSQNIRAVGNKDDIVGPVCFSYYRTAVSEEIWTGGVWYTYTPPVDQTVTIESLTNAPESIVESLFYTGTCGNLVPVDCDNRSVTLTAGTTYYLSVGARPSSTLGTIVAGPVSTTGRPLELEYSFVMEVPVVPVNDLCVGAKTVSALPYTDRLNITAATIDSASSSCVPGGIGRGVWYTYTAPANTPPFQPLAVRTLGPAGALAVFEGGCGGSFLTCGNTGSDAAFFETQPDQTYTVLFGNAAGASLTSAPFHRSVFFYNAVPSSNITCSSAYEVTSFPFQAAADTTFGSNGTLPVGCNSSSPEVAPSIYRQIFFTFTPPASGTVHIDISRNYVGGATALYSGPCNNLTPIYCGITQTAHYGDGSFVQPAVTADVEAGVRYTLVIGHGIDSPLNPACFNLVNIDLDVSCPADFNSDGVRDVADLFAYINAWLAKTPNADFNDDTTVDVADLFAYINAWLAGC